MYTRAYTKEKDGLKLPDNYSGTAFMPKSEPSTSEPVYTEPEKREIKISQKFDNHEQRTEPETKEEPTFSKIDQAGKFSFLSKRLRQISKDYHLPKLDFEDLLLIAIAAFIFLSQSEDIECAIMLLILVFIK